MHQDKRERQYVLAILLVLVICSQIFLSYSARPAVDENQMNTLYWVRHLFSFGLPSLLIFWQVSEVRAYSDGLPKYYFLNRFKFIFLPYLIFGGVYSLYLLQIEDSSFWEVFQNIVLQGNWHGYFVLVILQFTLLNMILLRLKSKLLKSFIPVAIAFAVSTFYLYFSGLGVISSFQFPYFNNEINILGWIFFYALGSFIGFHYDKVKEYLTDYIPLVVFGAMLAYGLFIVLNLENNLEVNIMNPSLLLYHSFGFLLVFRIALSFVGLKEHLVELIVPYTLFTLLFHPIVSPFLYDLFGLVEEQTILLLLAGLILILGSSIGVGTLLGQFTLTRFALGKFSPISEPIQEEIRFENEHPAEPELN